MGVLDRAGRVLRLPLALEPLLDVVRLELRQSMVSEDWHSVLADARLVTDVRVQAARGRFHGHL
ncbi:MAG TPA: hypothetical protein VII06_43530 [Chloroflexota bacterium]